MSEIRFIELFAGIGGFRLGLEPLGWKCVWANEIDPYACNVYQKNFGDKELFEGDIKDVDPNDIPEFDMLTGGFPCQDISTAGKREGITELNRSGLFYEIIRIVKARSPRWVFLENVSALLVQGRGMDVVLREFSSCGYDVQWDIVSAQSVGAPHVRKRIWIIAHPKSKQANRLFKRQLRNDSRTNIKSTDPIGNRKKRHKSEDGKGRGIVKEAENVANGSDAGHSLFGGESGEISNAAGEIEHGFTNNGKERMGRIITQPIQGVKEFSWCKDIRRIEDYFNRPDVPQPLIRREDDGFSGRVDRLKCLGNAVVPQVVTHVGRCIQDYIKTLDLPVE